MKNNRGVTIIELMIVLIILAVVSAIAFPNMRLVVLNNRASTQANELNTALNYARSEALKRGQVIELCPSDETGADDATCADSKFLHIGWIVRVEATGEVLRVWQPLPAGDRMIVSDPIRFAGTGALARTATGGLPVAPIMLSEVKGCKGDMARQVRVSLTGTVSTQRIECA